MFLWQDSRRTLTTSSAVSIQFKNRDLSLQKPLCKSSIQQYIDGLNKSVFDSFMSNIEKWPNIKNHVKYGPFVRIYSPEQHILLHEVRVPSNLKSDGARFLENNLSLDFGRKWPKLNQKRVFLVKICIKLQEKSLKS